MDIESLILVVEAINSNIIEVIAKAYMIVVVSYAISILVKIKDNIHKKKRRF